MCAKLAELEALLAAQHPHLSIFNGFFHSLLPAQVNHVQEFMVEPRFLGMGFLAGTWMGMEYAFPSAPSKAVCSSLWCQALMAMGRQWAQGEDLGGSHVVQLWWGHGSCAICLSCHCVSKSKRQLHSIIHSLMSPL